MDILNGLNDAQQTVKMPKKIMMAKIPDFESDEETAVWFDSHDTAVYMDSMEEVSPPSIVQTHL